MQEHLTKEITRFAIIEVDSSFSFEEWLQRLSKLHLKAAKFVFLSRELLPTILFTSQFPGQDVTFLSRNGGRQTAKTG